MAATTAERVQARAAVEEFYTTLLPWHAYDSDGIAFWTNNLIAHIDNDGMTFEKAKETIFNDFITSPDYLTHHPEITTEGSQQMTADEALQAVKRAFLRIGITNPFDGSLIYHRNALMDGTETETALGDWLSTDDGIHYTFTEGDYEHDTSRLNTLGLTHLYYVHPALMPPGSGGNPYTDGDDAPTGGGTGTTTNTGGGAGSGGVVMDTTSGAGSTNTTDTEETGIVAMFQGLPMVAKIALGVGAAVVISMIAGESGGNRR